MARGKGEITQEEFDKEYAALIRSDPYIRGKLEEADSNYWEKTKKDFDSATARLGLAPMARASDGDFEAELWLIQRSGIRLEAAWLIKVRPPARITLPSHPNQTECLLVYPGGSIRSRGGGAGDTLDVNGECLDLPKPYGFCVRRSFVSPTELGGQVGFSLGLRVRYIDREVFPFAETFPEQRERDLSFAFEGVDLPAIEEADGRARPPSQAVKVGDNPVVERPVGD